jgi:predicted DNA-binding transcriptional regulator YafY
MQYDSHARVIAPDELRDEIREELAQSLKLYTKRKDKKYQ